MIDALNHIFTNLPIPIPPFRRNGLKQMLRKLGFRCVGNEFITGWNHL